MKYSWLKKHGFLLLLLVIALFTRLYQLPASYMFKGDQGRDSLIMHSLLAEQKPILLGPTTSVGNYYLGPFFYYFSAPSLLLAGFNPIGPTIFQALLGTLAVGVLYIFARQVLSKRSSATVGWLFALSPSLIEYSRFAWNPNPTPLFAILAVGSFYQFLLTKNNRWFVATVIFTTLLWQLHYVLLVFGVILAVAIILWFKIKVSLKNRIATSLGLFPFMIMALLPLIASIYKNRSLGLTMTESSFAVDVSTPFHFIVTFKDFLTSILDAKAWLPLIAYVVLVPVLGMVIIVRKTINSRKTVNFTQTDVIFWNSLLLILVSGITGMTLLNSSLETHYILGFYPLIILLFGKGLDWLFKWKFKITMLLSGLFLVLFTAHSILMLGNIFSPSEMSADLIDRVSVTIMDHAQNQDFNFALLADTNEKNSYVYFFILHKVKNYRTEVTNQLYVVCENDPCNPSGNADWQIASFEAAHPGQVTYQELDFSSSLPQSLKVIRGTVESKN